MKLITLITTLLLANTAYAGTLREVCVVMTTLTPSLSKQDADMYSRSIVKYSKQYGVDWRVSVAIFKQESNFNHKSINWKSHDYGIGQMNAKTIQNRDIDLGALMTDHDYAIEQTFQMLKELQDKYGKIDSKNDLRWFTRYHSFTPSIRKNYRKLLDKHLTAIEAIQSVEKRRRTSNHTSPKVSQGVNPGDQASLCDLSENHQGAF